MQAFGFVFRHAKLRSGLTWGGAVLLLFAENSLVFVSEQERQNGLTTKHHKDLSKQGMGTERALQLKPVTHYTETFFCLILKQ